MSIREQLKSYLKSKNISQTVVADDIGLSPATLSSWMAEKYQGDNRRIETAVASFLERKKEKEVLKSFESIYVETENAKKIDALARIAHLDHKICVLTSDSGMGKSISLSQYAARNDGTLYIEVDPTFSPKHLFSTLRKMLGRPGGGMLQDIYDDCINVLKGTERLIIIDQAELLNIKALELIRCLWDKTQVGIVLAGMPKLIENIRGLRNEFAQLYTRIGSSMRLTKLSKDDASMIVNSHIDASEAVIDAYYKASRSNGRTLAMLLYNTIRVSQKSSIDITPAFVNHCASVLEV